MKVVCDNCRSVYKIPDDKLVKPVNKATCRKCGHRMLIPRPRQGASPDEKTLVTAVPPTPNPAPTRERGPTLFDDDDGEATLPGILPSEWNRGEAAEEIPLFPATPMPAALRSTPPTPAPAPRAEARAATPVPAPSLATPVPASRAVTPVPAPRARGPPPPPPPPRPPARPPPPRPPGPGPLGLRPPASAAPVSPKSSVSSADVSSYSPGGDLTFALLMSLGAWLGSVLLVAAVASEGASGRLAQWAGILGALLALGGTTANILVLVTGARGRRAAMTLVSAVLGVVVAVVGAGSMVGSQIWLHGGGQGGDAPEVVSLEADPAVLPEGSPPTAEASGVADATGGAIAAAGSTLPVVVTPPVAPAGIHQGSSSSSSTAAGANEGSGPVPQTFAPRPVAASDRPARESVAPGPDALEAEEDEEITLDDEDLAAIGAKKPAAPALATTVADEVIDTILRSNAEIKRCFFNERKATGTIPSRITVGLTIEPTGKIRDASVSEPEYRNSDLGSCLGRVLPGISMPPSSGPARRVTYPFRLQ